MDETTPASPPLRTSSSEPEILEFEFKREKGFWDWPRRIMYGSLAIIFGYGCYMSTQPYGRIVEGVRQKEAQVMSVELRNGIEHFLADYGRLPLPAGGATAKGDLDTDSGVLPELVAVLFAKEPPGTTMQNPRGTSYLDGIKPAKPGKKATGPPWLNGLVWDPSTSQYSVVDGWGNLYRLRLDTDGDGLVENPCIDEVAEGRPKLKARVIAWSPGKDGHEETWEDNPKSWD